MFDLIDTAITGDQFLLALHDTLIMVAVSLGFGALIGVRWGLCWWFAVPAASWPTRWCIRR